MLQTFWGPVWRFFKKLKVELPHDPATLLLGTYPEKPMIGNVTRPPCSLQCYLQTPRHGDKLRAECPPTDGWIKKMRRVYICACAVEYYSAIKKNEIMPFAATWMDLEMIILSEDREWQIPYHITHMWNLKKSKGQMNLFTKQKLTETENKLMVTKGEREERDNLGIWD